MVPHAPTFHRRRLVSANAWSMGLQDLNGLDGYSQYDEQWLAEKLQVFVHVYTSHISECCIA